MGKFEAIPPIISLFDFTTNAEDFRYPFKEVQEEEEEAGKVGSILKEAPPVGPLTPAALYPNHAPMFSCVVWANSDQKEKEPFQGISR